MNPRRKVSINFEHKGHRILLTSLLLMTFLSPFIQQRGAFQWLLAIILMMVLLAAVKTVANQAREYHIALVLGLLALIPQFSVLIDRSMWLDTVRHISMILFLFWVCALLLRDIIVRSHTVTSELILGAINIYLMAGLAFAFVFGLIELLHPGSFTGLEAQINAPGKTAQFIYFSSITLTTLGYGDIIPITAIGKTVSYVEAIFGQLYLAILVARLVGLYIAKSRTEG